MDVKEPVCFESTRIDCSDPEDALNDAWLELATIRSLIKAGICGTVKESAVEELDHGDFARLLEVIDALAARVQELVDGAQESIEADRLKRA